MKRIWNFMFICVALFIVITPRAFTQEKRPMTMIDLLNVPYLRDPQLSYDGKQLLYVLTTADWEANKQISHIWRVNIDGTRSIQLTNGKDGESSPRWSPDGKRIAFLAKREDDEKSQIYLIQNEGGEAHICTRHETDVSSITWSMDGTRIYFLADDPKTEEEKKREEKKDDVFAFGENYKQRHLWMISLERKEEQRLTEGNYTVRYYQISRDEQKVVISRAPTPLIDDSDEAEVWIMDITGENGLRLTENKIYESDACLSPDNTQVLFVAGANDQFDTYYNDNIFLVSATGGPSRLPIPDFPYEIQQPSWGHDGSTIYATVNMGLHSELLKFDVKKKEYLQITDGKHAIGNWQYSYKTMHHIFSINQQDNAGDVWMLSEDSKVPVQITNVYGYLATNFNLPRQEKITWKGEDGVMIEGLLVYPLDYQSGQRYPLVMKTHGGPAASDKFGFGSWSSYIQVLAAKGYAVFSPNYRGSTGYGNAFLRDMVGHYFKNAHLDVMAGVDHLIKEGIADPERMVKMGWSAGGHMTNKIITFTDRFKAASSGAGAINWISMYGQSDVRIYRTPWFGGTPWEENAPIDVYWENSPLKDISKVKTPTIVLVGQNDVRVPMPQSVELYRALKSNGIPTHLYVAPRAGHGWSELRHRLYKMNIELAWFEKYAMERDYIWEKAPGEEEEIKNDQ